MDYPRRLFLYIGLILIQYDVLRYDSVKKRFGKTMLINFVSFERQLFI